MVNSGDPDQILHYTASDLGLFVRVYMSDT